MTTNLFIIDNNSLIEAKAPKTRYLVICFNPYISLNLVILKARPRPFK